VVGALQRNNVKQVTKPGLPLDIHAMDRRGNFPSALIVEASAHADPAAHNLRIVSGARAVASATRSAL